VNPQNQIEAQREMVARMETSPCRCMLAYHPVGDEWKRVYKEWIDTNKTSAYHLVQLFGDCPDRKSEWESSK